MLTITMLSQKGGAGKTTLAINLAGAAEAAELRALIIDLDPQASARAWYDRREDKSAPIVIASQVERIHEILRAAKDTGADLCLIDTAPHSEKVALEAAKVADLILIPCRPSFVDLRAVGTSVDLVKFARRPAQFVISCVRPGDKSLPEGARNALSIYATIPVAPVWITLRSDCVHAFTTGRTVSEFDPAGAASHEAKRLLEAVSSSWNNAIMLSGKQQEVLPG